MGAMKPALIALTLLLSGCAVKDSPEITATAFFEALKAGDSVAAEQFFAAPDAEPLAFMRVGPVPARLSAALWKRMTYTLGKPYTDHLNDTLTPVRLKAVDLLQIGKEMIGGESDRASAAVGRIESPDAPMREVNLELNMVQIEGKWRFFPPPNLTAAMRGFLY